MEKTLTTIETIGSCTIVQVVQDGKGATFNAFDGHTFIGWGGSIEEAREIIADWNEA